MIYTAAPEARGFGRLRQILFPADYNECKALRDNLCAVTSPIASVTDIICGMAPRRFASKQRRDLHEVLVERCLALMAKAMQLGLEGSSDRSLVLEPVPGQSASRRP